MNNCQTSILSVVIDAIVIPKSKVTLILGLLFFRSYLLAITHVLSKLILMQGLYVYLFLFSLLLDNLSEAIFQRRHILGKPLI